MSFLRFFLLTLTYIRTPLTLGALLFSSAYLAYAQTPTEQQVKAVYIYNLVNFVEWPSTAFEKPSDPFVIGVAGVDTYQRLIEELVKDEKYKSRSIQVRSINSSTDARTCHILFIDNTSEIVSELLSETQGRPVLTVSENDNFMPDGGMIRFFVEESKVRIEINQKLSSENKLLISAKLLRLSKIYNEQ